jgi:hypothetical protein
MKQVYNLGLPAPTDTRTVLGERPIGRLLQKSERVAAVEWLAALFARIAFFEGIRIADDPTLLCYRLLHG